MSKDDRRCVALWNWLARSAEKQGNYQTCQHYAKQAQHLATVLDDQKGLATSLNILGIIANYQGEYTHANDLFQQSLALSRQLGDQINIANNLNALGIIAHYQGEYTRATHLHEQSLALRQQLGDKNSIAISFHNLGYTAFAQKEYLRANNLYKQSLVFCRQVGSQMTMCHNYMELGMVALRQGDGQAFDLFGQALQIAYRIQAIPLILWSVVGFVGALAQRQGEQAQRGAYYAGFVQSHPAQHSQVRTALAEILPLLEAALTVDELQVALEQGKTLNLDTVVQELLAEFALEKGT